MRPIGDRCEPRAEDDPEVLRDVLDATGLLIAVTDAGGAIVHVNRTMRETIGRDRDGACISAHLGACRVRGRARAPAQRVPASDGAIVSIGSDGPPRRRRGSAACAVDFSIRVVRRDTEHPLVLFAGVNLSERLRIEDHLRETEARQRMLLQHLPAVVWTTDLDLRFTSSVGAGLTALGLRPGEVSLVGTSLFSYFHTDDATSPVIAAHLRALGGEPVTFDMSWFGRTFHSRVEALEDPSGRIIGCVGVALDMTDRAYAEARLRDSEARFRRIFDSNMIGIVFWTREGRIVDANRAFFDMVGYTREDLEAGRISWRDSDSRRVRCGGRAGHPRDRRGVDLHAVREGIHPQGRRSDPDSARRGLDG